ncbi:MAG: anti-sigma factor antagonist [Roseburia sp.]|nr:anti-sigma factor antagonist [Roseburia sp.]
MREGFQCKDGYMTVQMPKEIDHHCAKELRQEIDKMLEVSHVRTLVFDFSQTEFMDSSGIGVLIGRCRNLGYSGGSVQAVHVSDRVQKIFMVSGLNKLIPIVADQEIAGGRAHGE